jgi:hypothetical protein
VWDLPREPVQMARSERAVAMSLRIVGRNPDGSRQTVDEGESRGRVAGYGGSALGHAITVPFRPRPDPPRGPEASASSTEGDPE